MIYQCKVCAKEESGPGPESMVSRDVVCADCQRPGEKTPPRCEKTNDGKHLFLSPHIDGSRLCSPCGYRWQPYSKEAALRMMNSFYGVAQEPLSPAAAFKLFGGGV